jgi:hypothetical protein
MKEKINFKKREQEVFKLYKKNKNKLTLSGAFFNPWFWRKGELSKKEFVSLSITEKEAHIKYLISLGERNRSTNDDYILKDSGPESVSTNIHYFSLDDNELVKELLDKHTSTETDTDTGASILDENVNVCEPVPFENENTSTEMVTDTGASVLDEIPVPSIDELITFGKEGLEEHLNLIFEFENFKWKDDLKFARTVEQFIENTQNYMKISPITIAHIHAYKKLI